jgi:hypothetical protein
MKLSEFENSIRDCEKDPNARIVFQYPARPFVNMSTIGVGWVKLAPCGTKTIQTGALIDLNKIEFIKPQELIDSFHKAYEKRMAEDSE